MKNIALWIGKWIWGKLGKWSKGLLRQFSVFMLVMALLAFMPGSIGRWAFNYWIAVDQFANTLTLGDPDETISSRVGKWSTAEDPGMLKYGASGVLCFFLDLVDDDHCVNSIEHDEGGKAVF